MHRNERLLKALLEISAWSAGDLRRLFEQPSLSRDLICAQLEKTSQLGAVELLAGFVRRRDLPQCITQVIQMRADETFRDALLDVIGNESSTTTQKNLQLIGMPHSCNGSERMVGEREIRRHAALIHVYVSVGSETIAKLQVVAAAAERGVDQCTAAAAIGLSRCETPEIEFWMRKAISVSDGNEAAIASDDVNM